VKSVPAIHGMAGTSALAVRHRPGADSHDGLDAMPRRRPPMDGRPAQVVAAGQPVPA
jgi:hypothetical protein